MGAARAVVAASAKVVRDWEYILLYVVNKSFNAKRVTEETLMASQRIANAPSVTPSCCPSRWW